VLGQPVELMLPQPPVRLQPRRSVPHRAGHQADAAHAPVPPALHEARTLEHNEVLADGRQRHGERAGELAHRGLAPRQPGDDGAAGGVGEGTEDGIEPREIVNHMV
jgi:hypothetical protein